MNQIATGTFIARKRKELNLTQAQLAERLDISSKSVSKWERGKCMPDYGIVNELCDALDITVSELLDGEENERENLRSAFARTRGFLLIVANARWDAEERTAGIFDDLARLFNDPKPTTARQCVQAAPALAQAQPTLVPRIAKVLEGVDPGRYPDTARPRSSPPTSPRPSRPCARSARPPPDARTLGLFMVEFIRTEAGPAQ